MTPKQFTKALEAAAEAGHDNFYSITPCMSDLGYAFADEETRRTWREVAVAMLQALEDV